VAPLLAFLEARLWAKGLTALQMRGDPLGVAPGTGLDLRPGQTAEPLRPDR